MRFSRQEYWSEGPCPHPGDLPNPGLEPMSLMSPALAGGSLPLVPGTPRPNFEISGKDSLPTLNSTRLQENSGRAIHNEDKPKGILV